jgi:hypothetical protein
MEVKGNVPIPKKRYSVIDKGAFILLLTIPSYADFSLY